MATQGVSLFPPPFFGEMIQFDFRIFFRWVVQLATGEVPSKGRLKHTWTKIVRLLADSGNHWSWFQGFHFVICSIRTFEILFLHCNVSPKNHPFPSISNFRFCSEFERAWGEALEFYLKGILNKRSILASQPDGRTGLNFITRWAPTSKELIYNPSKYGYNLTCKWAWVPSSTKMAAFFFFGEESIPPRVAVFLLGGLQRLVFFG